MSLALTNAGCGGEMSPFTLWCIISNIFEVEKKKFYFCIRIFKNVGKSRQESEVALWNDCSIPVSATRAHTRLPSIEKTSKGFHQGHSHCHGIKLCLIASKTSLAPYKKVHCSIRRKILSMLHQDVVQVWRFVSSECLSVDLLLSPHTAEAKLSL